MSDTEFGDGSIEILDHQRALEWLARVKREAKAEASADAARICERKACELSDASTSIDDDYSQFLFEAAAAIREQVK